ncbi:glycosyltransferase family 4 protein [Rhodopirellula sallentina]|uniref:Group 1 glycosyl transferase n=1 Tax=Rhodopirellula sallentina SM41 TaxID=1263870 RepID=M5TSU7_9BACT|nr:glycosyltransferase family 4 protein [Rhodopirellula sallentina]EMI52262.1 group 1 glycosyl transferase [Rhodopirellula sallentina SM41]
MRVLFLATYFPRPSNMRMGTWSLDHAAALRDAGMEVQVISLTPAIPRLAARVVPSVATYTDCPAEADLSGIKVHYPRWWCYPIKQFWRFMSRAPRFFLSLGWRSSRREVLAIVDRFQPDVVLANHSLVNGFVANQIKSARGIPYITVDHEVGDFFACRDHGRWMKVMKPVAEEASVGVTVSRTMEDIAEQVLPGVAFQTIYNGASFPPCDQSMLDRHVAKDDMVVFCCGNLYGRKDIQLLIHAFDRISSEYPHARLRIAGDGPDRDTLEEIASALPSKETIEFLGSIEHDAVQVEMQQADIFALVGWAEPFGVVFLEAMANGCPVVVSNDAGVAEILQDGETAIFTEPRDLESVVNALRSLCESDQRRATIARAGHAFYRDSCRWDHRAIEYREVLASCANAHQTATQILSRSWEGICE